MIKKLTSKQIKKAFFSNFEIDSETTNKLKRLNFYYKDLDSKKKNLLKDLKNKINKNYFWKASNDKRFKWNDGWTFNLNLLKKNKKIFPSIIPFYYKKDVNLVINGKIIQPVSKLFEFKLFGIYRDFLFKKYLANKTNIYELGCGPLHNLVILKKKFKNKNIYGFDWSDPPIKISRYLKKYFDLKLNIVKMDFFKGGTLDKIKPDNAIFTIGGFEQLGNNFKPIVNKIISSKTDLIINIESFVEFYNKKNLLEKNFYEYDKKRNYLYGYIKYLKKLERKKKIKILKINKVKFGILGHYSYSTIIWKTLK